MNEQTRRHLDEVNGNAKDLVAVVQYEETKDVLSLLYLGEKNVVLEGGEGVVVYEGKEYPVVVDVEDMGELLDEEVVDPIQPFKPLGVAVWDPIEKTMVTHPEAQPLNFIPSEARTVDGAIIYLTVNGKECKQDSYNAGKGSHVPCKDGTVLWRYTFVVPVRTFTGRGKSLPDE